MKKNLLFLFALSMFILPLVGCDKEDDITFEKEAPRYNIVEIAKGNGFTSLVAALEITGLTSDLQSNSQFTVFAPTNQAFDNLLAAIGQTDINDVPVSVLKEVLLYHVVQGAVFSQDVSDGTVPTLQGSSVTMNTSNGIKVNGSSVVSPYDIEASNGSIHTINEVLVPESVGQFVNTVLEPAYFNKAFSTLVSAAVKADLVGTLLNTPNLTIFAPSNDAFSAAGIDPDQIDAQTLGAVLTYHVVGAKVLSSEIPREAATVNGSKVYFSVSENGAFINGNTQVTAVDIESGSGVVHVIDNILLPPSGNIVETAIGMSAEGEFTSLIAALTRTANEGTADQNLINVLSGEGPFTVFAPTNAAFQAVLDSNTDWNTLQDIPLETLIAVLTYHVVPARAYDKDLAAAVDDQNNLPTAGGQPLNFDLSNFTINNSSTITGINYNATNGVIHIIDNVLIP